MNKRRLIYIILGVMTVGLATITTTLFVNGGVKLASIEEDFKVYFSDAALDGVQKSNLLISNDKQHINFLTKDLMKIGDESRLDFEVTNNSTQYDAHVELNCITDQNDYIELEMSRKSYDIVAQTRERDYLIVRLKNPTPEVLEAEISCILDTKAVSKDRIAEQTIFDKTYQITGTLQDKNGNTLENKNLVVYSDEPHYVTTDNFGFFYVCGLEKGEYEIYYVDNIDVTNKTKAEIKELSIDETSITTSDTTIKFNEIKLDDFKVEPDKTGKVDITFDVDGGTKINTQKVDLYTKIKNLPIPTKERNTFEGWLFNGKYVTSDTIINNEKNLMALWSPCTACSAGTGANCLNSVVDNICTYTTSCKTGYESISNNGKYNPTCTAKGYSVSVSGTNATLSKNSITIKYASIGTVDITPVSGYYVSGVSCTNGYTTNASTGTSATGKQTVTISNNSKDTTSACSVTTAKRNFTVTMSGSNVTFGASSISVAYGGTGTVAITPASGYYVSGVSCTNGYTTNASTGTSAIGKQTVTISNNSKASASTCTVTTAKRSFTVTFVNATGGSWGATSKSITYSGSTSVTITPSSNYVLGSISCTNNYTATYSVNSSSSQTVTIKNNSSLSAGTCTPTFKQTVKVNDYLIFWRTPQNTSARFDFSNHGNSLTINTSLWWESITTLGYGVIYVYDGDNKLLGGKVTSMAYGTNYGINNTDSFTIDLTKSTKTALKNCYFSPSLSTGTATNLWGDNQAYATSKEGIHMWVSFTYYK